MNLSLRFGSSKGFRVDSISLHNPERLGFEFISLWKYRIPFSACIARLASHAAAVEAAV